MNCLSCGVKEQPWMAQAVTGVDGKVYRGDDSVEGRFNMTTNDLRTQLNNPNFLTSKIQ